MDFLNFLNQRYSVRSFADKKVEEEKLLKVLEAGNAAPTAHNNQPQKIYAIISEEGIDKLKNATKYTFGAKCFLLVGYDKNESWHEINKRTGPGAAVDPAIVCTHMMLQAHSMGLGTLWVGNFDAELLKKEFGIKENITLINILVIGYESKDSKPHSFHNIRKKLDDTVQYL